jgi:hypothetical protein
MGFTSPNLCLFLKAVFLGVGVFNVLAVSHLRRPTPQEEVGNPCEQVGVGTGVGWLLFQLLIR